MDSALQLSFIMVLGFLFSFANQEKLGNKSLNLSPHREIRYRKATRSNF